MMDTIIESLERLEKQPRSHGVKRSYLTDEQWAAVSAARARGVTYRAMFEALPPGIYKNLKSFEGAFHYRRTRRDP